MNVKNDKRKETKFSIHVVSLSSTCIDFYGLEVTNEFDVLTRDADSH